METVKKKQSRALSAIKSDPVMLAALAAAAVSAFFVPPSAAYIAYIDVRVLCLLLSLMLVVAGLQKAGVFDVLVSALLSVTHNARGLAAVLTGLCFFTSMLITNDVALITFVPLAIMVLTRSGRKDLLIPVIVLQTVAANLGSMLTPLGNPQNLYLYALSGMSAGEFLSVMALPAGIALAGLAISVMFIKPGTVSIEGGTPNTKAALGSALTWGLMFVLCLLAVLRVLPYWAVLAVVVLVVIVIDRGILAKADYGLLLTFIFLFIFIGNMKSLPAVSGFISRIVEGRELLSAIAMSQVISNVPAAMLLSGFTNNYAQLLIGVNLGGLGTLIASMASLISFKLYAASSGALRGRYLAVFTAVNIAFLSVLWAIMALK